MAGEYFDGTIFGTDTLTTLGNNDMFLARVSPYGDIRWVTTYGSTELDRVRAVHAADDGTVFITGDGKAVFPNKTGDGGGPEHLRDVMVARYDGQGNLIWGHNLDGDIVSEGTDIVGTAQGESYSVGRMETFVFWDGDTINGNGGQDGFVIKWTASGNYVWGAPIGGAGTDDVLALGMDGQENIVLGGFYQGSITVGPSNLSSGGGKEALVVKMDSAGTILWARGFYGPDDEQIKAIKAAPDGSIYFAGEFENTVNVGGFNLTASNNVDIFFGKCDPAGNVVWARSAPGFSIDLVEDMEIDEWENMYLCGFYFGDLTFDGTTVTSGGFDDMFIAKTDSFGNLSFLDSPHYVSSRNAYGIAVDKQQNAVVCGSYFEILDLIPGQTITAVDSSIDFFLTKYATLPPSIVPKEVFGLDQCADSSIGLTYDLQGYFPANNTFTLRLSDANGSFGTATTVGTVQTGLGGAIQGPIPNGTVAGTGYRVRMRSSAPIIFSADNGTDLTLEPELSPPLELSGDTTVCDGQPTLVQVGTDYASVLWSTGATTNFTGILTAGDYWVQAVDTNGCSQYLSFTMVPCVGTTPELPETIRIYPNPSEGIFHLDLGAAPTDNYLVGVRDLTGRLLHQSTVDTRQHILELDHLAGGVYVLEIELAGQRWHHKIWVRR